MKQTRSEVEHPATATLRQYLHAHGGRYTPEREAILNAIVELDGHFSPEQVAHKLGERGTSMSVVTVYRNLPVLVDAGLVRRTCLSTGESTYELCWGRTHHDHMICTRCGDITEFQYEAIEVLQQAVAARFGFTIHRHHLELIGLCADCQLAPTELSHNSNELQ